MGNPINCNAESNKTSRFTPFPADCELKDVHLIGFVDYVQLGLDEYPRGLPLAVGVMEDGTVELHRNLQTDGFISTANLGNIDHLALLLQVIRRFRLQDPALATELWVDDPRLPFFMNVKSTQVGFMDRELDDAGKPMSLFDTCGEMLSIPRVHFDAFVDAITRFAYSTLPELLSLGSFFNYPAEFDLWLDGDSTLGKPVTGVYFLSAGSTIFYVGQSTDCHARIAQHRKAKKIPFTHVYIHPCPKDKLDDFEAINIMHFNPKYNKELPQNKRFFNDGTVRKITQALGIRRPDLCDCTVKLGDRVYYDADVVADRVTS